jgi:selenide,water dikinase
MGGRPLFALNLVGFPRDLLGEGLLDEIIRGGSETCGRAGIPILGGHSIDDAEPKYGLVAVGEVHPDRILTNAGARVGDALVLTKPLGTGVVATAIKAGAAAPEVVRRAVEVMATLNAGAARAAIAAGVEACTDVTGFGLLGHLHRMLLASGASAEVRAADVPLVEGAAELAAAGHVPGGSERNAVDLRGAVTWTAPLDAPTRTLLTDAQTSGGLLMCVAPGAVDPLLGALSGAAPAAAVIGRVTAGAAGSISVV